MLCKLLGLQLAPSAAPGSLLRLPWGLGHPPSEQHEALGFGPPTASKTKIAMALLRAILFLEWGAKLLCWGWGGAGAQLHLGRG